MSSMGLGRPPLIYPTPLEDSSATSSGVAQSPPLGRVTSPILSKYKQRRLKKSKHLGRKAPQKEQAKKQDHAKEVPKLVFVKDSEEYKLHLIRKIFLPKVRLDASIKDYLPALTSSGTVDIELYCFIGLLFKNFINEWYFKITESDEFISEVVDVVAHITRNLETRVRKINMGDLLLDTIPFILENHRKFYTYCLENLDSQYIQCSTMEEAFDDMNNHPALSRRFQQREDRPDSHETGDYNLTLNDGYYSEAHSKTTTEVRKELEKNYLGLLAKGSLALLLPAEITESDMARLFIRSVMSNVVLRILTDTLSEPDIIYSMLIKTFKSMKPPSGPLETHLQNPLSLKMRIVSFFGKFSHLIAYSTSTGSSRKKSETPSPPVVDRYIFRFLNNLFCFSLENPVLFVIVKYFSLWFLSYNIQEIRNVQKMKERTKSTSSNFSLGSNEASPGLLQASVNTIINSHLFAIKINKILYNLFEKLIVQKYFESDLFISSLIKVARNMIFPNDDAMGPPRKIPNKQEIEDMKVELFNLMKENTPYWLKLVLFNEMGSEVQLEAGAVFDDEEDDFEILSRFKTLIKSKTDLKFHNFIESLKYQKYNKLLIYNLMDQLFLVLFPELKNLTPSMLENSHV